MILFNGNKPRPLYLILIGFYNLFTFENKYIHLNPRCIRGMGTSLPLTTSNNLLIISPNGGEGRKREVGGVTERGRD